MTSQNLNQNPRTLLPKFYGLYCIQSGGINIRLVVMNNVLPRCVKMRYKYDLKGSTYKRRASRKEREKACPTYKDLDFQDMHEEGLYFDTETYNNLMKTLQRDCRVGLFGGERGEHLRQKVIYSDLRSLLKRSDLCTDPSHHIRRRLLLIRVKRHRVC